MTAPAAVGCVPDNSCPSCCTRAAVMWAEEELMASAAYNGGLLLTDLVDMLSPGRARLVVALCLEAGGRLEHGDRALFEQACAPGRAGAAGWWRQALNMPARAVDDRPARPSPFTA